MPSQTTRSSRAVFPGVAGMLSPAIVDVRRARPGGLEGRLILPQAAGAPLRGCPAVAHTSRASWCACWQG